MNSSTSASRPQAPSTISATLLVAEREINAQIRSKSFIISTVILLAIVLIGIVVSSFMAEREPDPVKVAVLSSQVGLLQDIEGLDIVEVQDESAIRDLVMKDKVAAGIVSDSEPDNPTGLLVLASTQAPEDVMSALTFTAPVELLDPPENDISGLLRYVISLAFGLIFMMAAMTFGSTIAQNTVQEKQSRIVEILLSTVSSRALLGGKIIGNSVVAFGQIAAIAAVAIAGMLITGKEDLLGLLGAPIAWFVVFFAVGFVLLASIFAASAALVSRIEDTGPVLTPVMMLIMIPYFLVVVFNDNTLVMTIMSYVPFSAPVGMPVRMFLGEASWWEPLLSLGILALSTVGVIAIGAKIYERSLLRMGGRVKLKEVLKEK